MKRGRTVRNGTCVLGSDKGCKLFFKRGDLWTLRDPSAQDDTRRRVRFAPVHKRFDDRDHRMLFLFSRHHETRRSNPSSKPTAALKPS